MNNLTQSLSDSGHQAANAVGRFTRTTLDQGQDLVERGADALQQRSAAAVAHVRRKPMQTLLVVAGVLGATLAIAALLRRSRY